MKTFHVALIIGLLTVIILLLNVIIWVLTDIRDAAVLG